MDYGCGTGPVATAELVKHSYKVNLYDPYFENHPEVFEETYDFIICCEVMEHFHNPFEEFNRLFKLLMLIRLET
ncbi:methyltransferase domain-containing protein [Gillisia limnaea]|uniref:methyltransferase domain-containing protein n=1 Tax=Gillisia limnaea TaxID=195907 RepID=UPI00067FAC55